MLLAGVLNPSGRIWSRLRRAGIFLAWFALAGAAWAQTEDSSRGTKEDDYLIRTWETDDGLPQNSVVSMVQTAEGYLWMGTFAGLVRFDGARFDVIDRRNTVNFVGDAVLELYADGAGRLWAGTDRGVSCWEGGGQWRAFTGGQGVPDGVVKSFVEDQEGDFLLSVGSHLTRFAGDRFLAMPLPDRGADRSPVTMVVDKNGLLWAASEGYLGYFVRPSWVRVLGLEELGADRLLAIAPSREGGVWAAQTERVRRWRGGIWNEEFEAPWEFRNDLHCLLEDSEGRLWAGGFTKGLLQFRGERKVLKWTRENGLRQNTIRALLEDREGSVWVGTDGGGVSRFRAKVVATYGAAEGLEQPIVKSVAEISPGRLLVGTHGGGAVELAGDRFGPALTSAAGALQAGSWIGPVLADSSKTQWIGTYGEGLFRREAGQDKPALVKEIGAETIFTLYEDRKGAVWIGAESGLGRVFEGALAWFGKQEGLPLRAVRAMTEDAEGTLWAAAGDEGLFRKEGDSFMRVERADGAELREVWSLHGDKEGSVWIGTTGQGLSRWRDGLFTDFHGPGALPFEDITCILEDASGNLWLGTHQGIVRVSKKSLNSAVPRGQSPRGLDYYWITRSDGLATTECSGGYQPAGLRGSDGRLWFATLKGLVGVDPGRIRPDRAAPHVAIHGVMADGRPLGLKKEALELPPRSGHVQIEYSGISLAAPEKVRFQTRLEPLEDGWGAAVSERTASFRNLAPGKYRFHVRASKDENQWSPQAAQLAFAIQPAYWQTGWFRAAAAAAAALALTGGIWRAQHHRWLREARDALLESERFARGTIDALAAHICVVDETGRIIAVNKRWTEFSLVNAGGGGVRVLGANYLEVCEAAAGLQAAEAGAFASGLREVISGRRDEFEMEYACQGPRQLQWFTGRATRFYSDRRLRVVIAHENITSRKMAEQALKLAHDRLEQRVEERTAALRRANELLETNQERLLTMSLRLMEIQESERRTIAKELHDEVGQILTSMKILLEMSARQPTVTAQKTVAEAKELASELMERVRQMSLNLRPPMLDDLGLMITLDWHCRRFTKQTQVQVHLSQRGFDGRLSPQIETACYRIVQEALTNVARHAGVKEAFVDIWKEGDSIQLQIRDLGRGFDADAVLRAGTSNGLSGMRERVDLLEGQFEIESGIGLGTKLLVTLPLIKTLIQ